MFDKELKNKDYFWQMQAYMMLTGHEESELVYCLTNTPFQIVEDEVRRAHWKLNLIDEDLDVREAVQASHNFDHLPDTLRVKRFIIKRDNEALERVKQRVEIAREYYESLRTIFFVA
jgi:hypothetical protein